MLDGSEYEVLNSDYEKFKHLYFSNRGNHKEAFETLFESVGMILKRYETEVQAMEEWYAAQEAKMELERQRKCSGAVCHVKRVGEQYGFQTH